ncbi:hypothetical protein BDW72DRAFT_172302 [Aspergillus terricola var. indicus]
MTTFSPSFNFPLIRETSPKSPPTCRNVIDHSTQNSRIPIQFSLEVNIITYFT